MVRKHRGEDTSLLLQRKEVYEAAKKNNPLRWSGNTRKWQPIRVVTLNPEKQEVIEQLIAA